MNRIKDECLQLQLEDVGASVNLARVRAGIRHTDGSVRLELALQLTQETRQIVAPDCVFTVLGETYHLRKAQDLYTFVDIILLTERVQICRHVKYDYTINLAARGD